MWSREHKAPGQSQGPTFQGQTLSRPRTGMFEAKAKDQGHNAQAFSKKLKTKKALRAKNRKFSAKFQAKKKGHDLGPVLTNQKIVLSSTENRKFSRTYRLRGQGQGFDLRGQGQELQKVFLRPRTPPLVYRTFGNYTVFQTWLLKLKFNK